ncbi:aspartic peptidase domain-containing protein [Lentinula aff. lateritia]|uniref:Aspartic peptidase domain-containing protein n=1 Tax=Lentinula aff. lateritia TaxID=2804960 RepID=A0ACC1UDS7_9AGAR|nr:aspartic peptidase domain-containing protein [Lentinula aff. lateritia]
MRTSLVLVLVLALSPAQITSTHNSKNKIDKDLTGIHVPIYRTGGSRTKAASDRRRLYSTTVHVTDFLDVTYKIPLKIGDREVAVDIDTGSSDLWIIVDNSSGFRSTTYPISLLYGDSRTGTHASGVIAIDSVAVASLNLKSQIFAAVNDTNTSVLETGCVGILGLGFPLNRRQDANNQDNQDNIQPKKNNRRHSSTGPSPWTPRLLAAFNVSGPPIWRIVTGAQGQQQTQSQDIINMRPMFSVSLQRVTNTAAALREHPRESITSPNRITPGLLTIGGLPPNLTDADLTWTLVRRYTVSQGGSKGGVGAEDEVYPITWEIPIDGVYLDGNRIPDPAGLESGDIGVTALIDTGNSLIRGPPDVVEYIVDAIRSSSSHQSTDPSTSCTTPHTLAFQIGGRMFPVEWRDLVWVEEEEEEDGDSQQGDSEKRQCYLNLAPTDVPTTTTTTRGEGGEGGGYLYSWSLGDPFLKNVIAAFYYGDTVHPSWDPPRIGLISTVPIIPILMHVLDVRVDVEDEEDVGAGGGG